MRRWIIDNDGDYFNRRRIFLKFNLKIEMNFSTGPILAIRNREIVNHANEIKVVAISSYGFDPVRSISDSSLSLSSLGGDRDVTSDSRLVPLIEISPVRHAGTRGRLIGGFTPHRSARARHHLGHAFSAPSRTWRGHADVSN